jgi:regulator of sigma E protease
MREPVPVLAAPAAGTLAAQAGVRDGDRVLSLTANDHTEAVRSWNDLRMAVFSRVRGCAGCGCVASMGQSAMSPGPPAEYGGDPEQDPLATLGLALKGGPVTITEIVPIPRRSAGLKAGDTVVAWHGQPLTQAGALIRGVRARPGRTSR